MNKSTLAARLRHVLKRDDSNHFGHNIEFAALSRFKKIEQMGGQVVFVDYYSVMMNFQRA